MERLAKLVSFAAVACFVGSAAFIYGQFVGLGHRELIWYLGFSDIVNHAPATVLVYGGTLAMLVLYDLATKKAHQTKSRWRWAWTLAFIAAMSAVWYFMPAKDATSVIGVTSVLLSLGVLFHARIVETLGGVAYQVIDAGLWALAALILLGYSLGATTLHDTRFVRVQTASETLCSTASVPLDRGLVLVDGDQFKLLPWSTVQRITSLARGKDVATGQLVNPCLPPKNPVKPGANLSDTKQKSK